MANSKRKCRHCGERSLAETMVIVPLGAFCNFDCATLHGKANQDKGRKIKQKAERKELRERKEKLKTAGDYIKEAQAAVNKYVRIRDEKKPCVSCGRANVSVFGGYKGACGWDAGHYRSRGAASHLRFNVLNIHKQCAGCNRFGSGMAHDYRIELIRRIGLDNVEQLENDNTPRKFTIEYLKRIKSIFNKRARLYERLFR